MSFAYLPLFTGDYLRDTRHLTPQRHGIYLLFLMYCWDQKGPLPLDEQECAGIANCRSADEVEGMRYVLGRYFVKMDDGWYNKRISEVLTTSEQLSNARSEAGRLGGLRKKRSEVRAAARAKQTQAIANDCLSKAKQESGSPSPSSINTNSKAGTRGTRLPDGWRPAEALAQWARAGRPDLDLDQTLAKFTDYWKAIPGQKGCKLDWDATYRNWVRGEPRAKLSVVSGGPGWWTSEQETLKKGEELSLRPRAGEGMADFRARIRAKLEQKVA